MTEYLALPPALGVRGTVAAPSSKSATNRALVLASLSPEPVDLTRPLHSDDTRALSRCLAAMGASIEPTASGLRVRGPLRGSRIDEVVLDVESSGTAARFLTAIAAATPGRWTLTGSEGLRRRPVGELVSALRAAGARIDYRGEEGRLPVSIEGRRLDLEDVAVDASRSSQFFSALLLAAAASEDGGVIRPTGTVASAPYVETTIEALTAFGRRVRREPGGGVAIAPGESRIEAYAVPGDWSSGLPLLAAAGIAGGEVIVTGLSWPSADADAAASRALEQAGITIHRGADGVRARGDPRALAPIAVRAADFPDAVPVLAAVAAFAPGQSRFEGVAHLKWKESDRLAALVELLGRAGAPARERGETLEVDGRSRPDPEGGLVRFRTFDDHRVAMAAALVSLSAPRTLIENPACVAKSYPAFFRDLETILVRGRRGVSRHGFRPVPGLSGSGGPPRPA